MNGDSEKPETINHEYVSVRASRVSSICIPSLSPQGRRAGMEGAGVWC